MEYIQSYERVAHVLYRPFSSQGASVLLEQMPGLLSQLSWPRPALLADLRLQGRTRPPREAAGAADARGNKALECKAQLELSLMSWNKYARVCSLRQRFSRPALCISLQVFVFGYYLCQRRLQTAVTLGRWNIWDPLANSFCMTLNTVPVNPPL